MEVNTPFGQLQPLQGGNLARVADLEEAFYKLPSMQVQVSSAWVSVSRMNCSMEQPRGNRCTCGTRAACVNGHSINTKDSWPRAPMLHCMQAWGRMGDAAQPQWEACGVFSQGHAMVLHVPGESGCYQPYRLNIVTFGFLHEVRIRICRKGHQAKLAAAR